VSVRYIRVRALAELFSPAVRAFGNIAIVGDATAGPTNTPTPITNPADAAALFPGALGKSIQLAFTQTPGPSLVFGVRTGTGPGWAAALTEVSTLDVQFVVLAATPLDSTSGVANGSVGAIVELERHVVGVSNTGDDGTERMGIAMLAPGSTSTSLVTGELANERMIYVAHNSTDDAAAAVAGTIAGYEPHISPLLKPVNITSAPFTAAKIATLNGPETFSSGPAGQGVLWLTDPVLIPGRGTYLGEAYTGNPGGKKYIDIVRTVDDVSFRLKARLIKTIGDLRISRSGLRSLVAQMEAVLDPLVRQEVIEDYDITVPILTLLDKDPDILTVSEVQQITNAQNDRVVEVLAAIDYAGAIHRLALTLKFV
jgi:hypothetical protein